MKYGAYNRQQWIDSFEGQLSLLRPHLTARVLASISLAAWHEYGARGEEPVSIAKAAHAALQATAKPETKRRR